MADAVGESDDQARASLAKVSAFSANYFLLIWLVLTNVVAFLCLPGTSSRRVVQAAIG
jgi:hypothetical protein